MQCRVADQDGRLDRERPDRTRREFFPKGREHPAIPTLRQPDDRFRPGIVVFVGQPIDQGRSKIRRVHVHLRPQRKGRPITDVSLRVPRQFNQDAEGFNLLVTRECEDEAVSNVGVGMVTETRRGDNGLGHSEVTQGGKDRLEDFGIVLPLQHAQEGAKARPGERAIGDSELPENVGPHPALDCADALTEPDGRVQDLASATPM